MECGFKSHLRTSVESSRLLQSDRLLLIFIEKKNNAGTNLPGFSSCSQHVKQHITTIKHGC